VLTGTGTAGAYHAGVLRALHEAGVKIDIVAGRGIGVIGAFFTAIDGGARLWDPGGLWRAEGATRLYGWRATLRAAAWTLSGALSVLLLPLAVLVSAVLVLPVAFLMRAIGLDGDLLASGYARLVDAVFQPAALPVLLPRVVVVVLSVFLAVLVGGAVVATLRAPARRRSRGAFWWSLLGTPLDVTYATEWFTDGLWQLMRGAAPIKKPSNYDLGSRYSELLGENVGQPGFRELIVVTHDVDARRDLTFALLTERHRRGFFLRSVGQEGGSRHLETMDLAGAASGHAVDALGAALRLPVATEPHLLRFAPDSQWRGETHRVCDRPDATARLLEEVAHAGAEQVVLVSALPEAAGPHTLSSGHRDGRGRAGEHLAAAETAALRDAVRSCDALFQAIFHIRPSHNPLGPFDFRGCYDELSDRRQSLAELVDRGYEDGFRQFVDSVVGASGEFIESSQSERRGEGPSHQEIAT
jgi:hypothetical protein